MEIEQLCVEIRGRVASELKEEEAPAAREALLISALYELSNRLLPELGRPSRSREYQVRLLAVGELISFLCIALIRNGGEPASAAVLSELSEGCRDPLLRKKLAVYAQELLCKREARRAASPWYGSSLLPAAAGCAVAALLLWYGLHLLPQPHLEPATGKGETALAPQRPAPQPQGSAPPQQLAANGVAAAGHDQPPVVLRQLAAPVGEGGAPPADEMVTRIRIVGNQVLVPVTLKNGEDSVRAELVLDTGATRTAVHETVAALLHIGAHNIKSSQSEVADGRTISARTARLDAVGVGPFSMQPAEVILIPYQGEGGHAGLLGMDFLAKHRYQVDMEHALIRWF